MGGVTEVVRPLRGMEMIGEAALKVAEMRGAPLKLNAFWMVKSCPFTRPAVLRFMLMEAAPEGA